MYRAGASCGRARRGGARCFVASGGRGFASSGARRLVPLRGPSILTPADLEA